MIESVNVTIHAVFVSKASGEVLKEHALGEEGECCIFPFQNAPAWTVLAISFISFLVVLGILIIAIFAPRHWLYSQGRNQLPKSVDTKIVEALPCFTFSSTGLGECHSEETCAICLENYKDEEILKVLPCQHGKFWDVHVDIPGIFIIVVVSVSSSRKAVGSVVYVCVCILGKSHKITAYLDASWYLRRLPPVHKLHCRRTWGIIIYSCTLWTCGTVILVTNIRVLLCVQSKKKELKEAAILFLPMSN